MAYVNSQGTVYEAEELGIGLGQWEWLTAALKGGAQGVVNWADEMLKRDIRTQSDLERLLEEAHKAGATPAQLAEIKAKAASAGIVKPSFMDRYGIYLLIGGAVVVALILLRDRT